MILKFVFDRVMALLGLFLLWPVILLIAILIKMKMPGGPVFFVQKRVGRGGKNFDICKFRTMINASDVTWSSVSIAGESRITPLGAILRKYKIDAIPELWNVLIGDMSFVGPRPDVPGYADKLQGENRVVLKLRPGITGPASLKYRREEEMFELIQSELREKGELRNERWGVVHSIQEFNDKIIYPDKVRLNIYYYKHYSFVKDLQMILCTVLGKNMVYAGEVI